MLQDGNVWEKAGVNLSVVSMAGRGRVCCTRWQCDAVDLWVGARCGQLSGSPIRKWNLYGKGHHRVFPRWAAMRALWKYETSMELPNCFWTYVFDYLLWWYVHSRDCGTGLCHFCRNVGSLVEINCVAARQDTLCRIPQEYFKLLGQVSPTRRSDRISTLNADAIGSFCPPAAVLKACKSNRLRIDYWCSRMALAVLSR